MRVSPVGFALDTVDEVLAETARSAAATHDHPEGIKGAQATALAVFRARSGADKARFDWRPSNVSATI
jgi:ADP-ribosylglycohydrolase